jgi:hypothetical protein
MTIAFQLCFSICHQKGPQDRFKLNGKCQLLVYADDNILSENINIIKTKKLS